jgi:hypothetical protein
MSGPLVFGTNPYADKSPVCGRIVAVLRGVSDRRGLHLEAYRSRALPRFGIHEFMITDEQVDVKSTVNRVALLAFFEVTDGGVILLQDRVRIRGIDIGTIAGFDDTHMPNHQNICLAGELQDGVARGLQLGAGVVISRE